MTFNPSTITTELLQHIDGRPVAYVDATSIAVFVRQQGDGTYLIDICTRDNESRRLRLLLDGEPLPALPLRIIHTSAKCAALITKGDFSCDQSLISRRRPGSWSRRHRRRRLSRRCQRGQLRRPPGTPPHRGLA